MVLSQESCYQKYSDATAEESCIANVVTKKLHAENCRYIKNMPLTEKNIEKICKWFQLSYSISNDTVFIRTAFASWIVYLQDNKVKKLLHENYRSFNPKSFKKQKLKCTEGYHKQTLPSDNFYEVVEYIKCHDSGAVKRMSEKSRLEKLLEQVASELKIKDVEEADEWKI